MQITTNSIIATVGKILILFVLAWGAYRMADIAMPYLVPPFHTNIDFLQSKQHIIHKSLDLGIVSIPYLWAFYVHISSSMLVIAAGITQFSRRLMFNYPKVHRIIGIIYVFTVLLLSAPSGFVMAFFGNGGAAGQYAFVLQSICWWFITFMAYRSIRQGKLREHGEWMLRSYALTFSAISLRAASYVLFWFQAYHSWYYPDSYILFAWLSWLLNLMIAEALIAFGFMGYYLKQAKMSRGEREG